MSRKDFFCISRVFPYGEVIPEPFTAGFMKIGIFNYDRERDIADLEICLDVERHLLLY